MALVELSDGLELRWIEAQDGAEIYELVDRNREHLRPWMSLVESGGNLKDVTAFVAGAEAALQARTAFQSVIVADRRIVGVIDLHDLDWPYRNARIGYWLDETHTGRGIMTRAARAMTQYGFEKLQLNRIEIHVATANSASRAVAERIGYRLEGILRDAQRIGDRYLDHALYAMLSRDWPGSNSV